MGAGLFWFNEEQGSKIKPHLPTDQRGPEREDDRRILSGIMPVMKAGRRGKDCPPDYGPPKTIDNRFARWSERGVWRAIVEAVAGGASAPPQRVAIDSSHVQVDRCATGGKGGRRRRRSASPKAAETPRSMRSSTTRVAPWRAS